MNYQPGDIFLINSESQEAKIVRYLMRSYTVWQYLLGRLYEFISKKKAPQWLMRDSHYYHAGMIYNSASTIEQEGVVGFQPISRLSNKTRIVIRRNGVTPEQQAQLASFSLADIGKKYDVLGIFGKTLTWLTGIPYFAIWLHLPHTNICVNREAREYYKEFKETWGTLHWLLVTTNDVEYYVKANPDKYIIVEEIINPTDEK
jgi:hypothetical protein